MRKKFFKLTALILSLALAFSLALPALAFEDTDPPFWQQWDCSSLEEFLEWYDYSEEAYYRMAASVLENQARTQAWIAAHPEEYAAFDPEEYFSKAYPFYDSIEKYMEGRGLTREEFEADMRGQWVQVQINAEQREQEMARFLVEYPEECAAFDPSAYFMDSSKYYYDSPQEYIQLREMTQEEFYREMFLEWMKDFQSMVHIKETFGGSAHGINVMVDGQCVPFPDVRPELTEGRTMVPVTFFAQQLGYDVYWDSNYRTAVLMDLQGLAEEIDEEFTLFNRILYAASGAGLIKEGQAAEQTANLDLDITLFNTLDGDERIPVKLRGTALYNDQAVQLTLSGDLSALMGRYPFQIFLSEELTDEELDRLFDQYYSALSGFSLEAILNLDAGAVYCRCPGLFRLYPDLVEDPDAWIAVPVDPSEFPLDSLTSASSVGQLALDSAAGGHDARLFDMDTPFWYWNNIGGMAYDLSEYVGDGQFTRSGGSFTRVFDLDLYDTYDGDLTAALKVTPSGEHSCTYSLTCSIADPDWALKLNLSGSSGKTGLDLSCHIKNVFKFTLDVDSRISGSSQQPLSVPPAGSKVEYPLGAVGSREL